MPRTLAQNAQYIAETIKPAIKSAIEAQGVTVPSTDSFLDYADRIAEIEGGGSGYQLKDLPTGSISTVSDAEPLPLNALKVSVDAVQDLHGYDHPWVGGAGKNKLPMTVDGIKAANTRGTWSEDTYTVNGISFTVNTDDGGNITSIKVNGVTTTTNARLELSQIENMSGNILNGCPQGGSSSGYKLRLANLNDAPIGEDIGSGYTLTTNSIYRVSINVGENTSASNLMFYPMIRLSSADATFTPYSNICPIHGWDSGKITVCDDIQSPTQTKTYTLNFPQTIYGGEWDVVDGSLSVTDGYIASYNGETLPSTWISDRDVYASGTTPTTGAEVVYKLATPATIDLSPLSIRLNEGVNNLYADCGEVIEGEYFVDEGAHRYQLYDYIQSDGTQYINTGRKVNAGDTFDILYSVISPPSGGSWSTIWGAYDGNRTTRLVLISNNQKDRIDDGTQVDRTSYATNNIYFDSFAVNNALDGDVYVFSGTNDIAWTSASIRLYSFAINDNYYLPVKRKSDGVFGLFDVANQAFLTDSASGNAFVGGNPTGVEV
jgi:hypothetical protein